MSRKGKRRFLICLIVSTLIPALILGTANWTYAEDTATYIGPEACKLCHGSIYDSWKEGGHDEMLLTAEEAQAKGFPLPEGVSWDDVAYTVGGIWKIRYIDKEGYFITWHYEEGQKVDGGNQWNIATQEWVDYHPGEEKPYTCGGCHTTGYSAEGHQNDMPGIMGTWDFRGITCESCHGPGSEHVTGPSDNPMVVDVSGQLCGQCHVRTSSGFPEYELGNPDSLSYEHGEKPHKHHQQFADWNASGHADELEPFLRDSCLSCKSTDNIFNTDLLTLSAKTVTVENAVNPRTCVSCHEPHKLNLWITRPAIEGYPIEWELGSEADENSVCIQCHTSGGSPETKVKEEWHHAQGELFTGSIHYLSDVTCVKCHMALDTKSAVAYDLRNHTLTVKSFGTYDYTCGQAIGCHKEQGTEWANLMIEEIQTTVDHAIELTEEAIVAANNSINVAVETEGVSETVVGEAQDLLLQAQSHMTFVEADGSKGFHNPTYALSLLNKAVNYAREAESTALEATSKAAEVQVSSLEAEKATLEAEKTTLSGRVTTLEGQVSTLQSEVSSLQGEVETWKSKAGAGTTNMVIGAVVGLLIGAVVVYFITKK